MVQEKDPEGQGTRERTAAAAAAAAHSRRNRPLAALLASALFHSSSPSPRNREGTNLGLVSEQFA